MYVSWKNMVKEYHFDIMADFTLNLRKSQNRRLQKLNCTILVDLKELKRKLSSWYLLG